VERCTVGNQETGERIHKIFLSNEIIILEGICLDLVQTGIYMLCAQPINLAEVDGSPCRAILIRNFAESK
jgi:arylformamidase